jgi:hypothetical protein
MLLKLRKGSPVMAENSLLCGRIALLGYAETQKFVGNTIAVLVQAVSAPSQS